MSAIESPKHLAIIPDGNRRWSVKHGIDLEQTYALSSRILDKIILHAVDHGVEYITIWPVSNRTWRRDKSEIDAAIDAVRTYLAFAKTAFHERGFRFRRIGSDDRLRGHYPSLLEEIDELERSTADCNRATIILAIDYSGREEIVRAVRRLLAAGAACETLDAESFKDYLDAGNIPDPDLLIRTGGDRRLSGFMNYQIEYAELFFCDELLPDFDIEKMTEIFKAYSERRYSQ